jgi:MFS family permease
MGWYGEADGRTRRVFWTCAAGWAMDSADSTVYQYLIPLLSAALGMTLVQATGIASVNFFAAAIGGWTGGMLCDRFGRARVLQFTILWFSFFSFASGFVQDYHQLLAVRILQGLGFGAEWAVGAVLLGEIIAPQHRGKALGAVHSGAAVGSGIAALLAGPVAAAFPPDIGWRVAFWLGILPAVLIFSIRRGSDDSELFKRARERQAAASVRTHGAAIFSPRRLRVTLLATLLSLGTQGAAYSVANFLTVFMTAERHLDPKTAGICVMFNSLGGFFGFLVNGHLSDRVGRRSVFRLFGLGFLLMASIYLLSPIGGNVALLIAIGMVYGFFQFGMYASFGPYFTELFPTELRGSGQSFAYNAGRAGAALFFMGVPLLARQVPLTTAMAVFAISGVVLAAFSTLFLPETVGRALHSLHEREG